MDVFTTVTADAVAFCWRGFQPPKWSEPKGDDCHSMPMKPVTACQKAGDKLQGILPEPWIDKPVENRGCPSFFLVGGGGGVITLQGKMPEPVSSGRGEFIRPELAPNHPRVHFASLVARELVALHLCLEWRGGGGVGLKENRRGACR